MPNTLTADGTEIFYTDEGDGPCLVFTHSWGLNSAQWQYIVADLLDAGFRCVTYDRRGHGRSDRHRGGWTMDLLADDLAGLLDELTLKDVTLVGHSMGCGEIVRYVTRHGTGRIGRAVLVAPQLPLMLKTPDNPDGVDSADLDAALAALKQDVPQWCVDNGAPFFGRSTVSAGMMEWIIRQIVDTPVKTLADTQQLGARTDYREELREFDLPTLLIHGDADASTPIELTGRRTAALLPRAKLIEIGGAGHGVFVTHAARIVEEIREFA